MSEPSKPSNPLGEVAAAGPPDAAPAQAGAQRPMKAFDHLRALFDEAGGPDGIYSRDDANRLFDRLRADGRGTEALAARHLFDMIDAFDDAPGARVTRSDFDRTRPLVQAWLAAHEGLSTPAGRALAELGHILDLGRRSAIPLRVVEQGLQHIAGLLTEAARGDGIVSRADAGRLIRQLEEHGRGNEALTAEKFFRMIDHRDHRPGARVTVRDINQAVQYARQHLIRRHDTNHDDRFSEAEVQGLSTTVKGFIQVGLMVSDEIIAGSTTPLGVEPTTGMRTFDVDALVRTGEDAYRVFAVARDIARDGVGGRARALEPDAVAEDIRSRIQGTTAALTTAFEADFPGRSLEVRWRALDQATEGDHALVGYEVYLEMRDEQGRDQSWSSIFDLEGNVTGYEFTGSPHVQAGTRPRRGSLPNVFDSWDLGLPRGWTPRIALTDPGARDRFHADPGDEAAFLVNLARTELLEDVFAYRRENDSGPVTEQAGTWEVGTIDLPSGEEVEVVRWRDIDDASFTLSFRKTATEGHDEYRLLIKNFDN